VNQGKRHRGWLLRTLGLVIGFVIGAGLIVGLQVPISTQTATFHLTTKNWLASATTTPVFSWPKVGSGAVTIPSLGLSAASPKQPVVPIASLTKLMTAYVTLQALPLNVGESGPCLYITASDVAEFHHEVSQDESNVRVALGEHICELQLLEGLIVHSAGNFAVLLSNLIGGNVDTFVALMNSQARTLGLKHTHYADPAGIDPRSVSTASDQAALTTLLMRIPLMPVIARMTKVYLPYAGVVGTYTPLNGTHGVIGVKSGITNQAGGCDDLALQVTTSTSSYVIYAIVLGQRGANSLALAGDAAYALAVSAQKDVATQTWSTTTIVGTVGWSTTQSPVVIAKNRTIFWLSATALPSWSYQTVTASSHIRRGQVVARLHVRATKPFVLSLIATRGISRPLWWQGLR
jgi:D-alanyl-D-alanine carboxypeptidase (penicillin-binding protein 5/6)